MGERDWSLWFWVGGEVSMRIGACLVDDWSQTPYGWSGTSGLWHPGHARVLFCFFPHPSTLTHHQLWDPAWDWASSGKTGSGHLLLRPESTILSDTPDAPCIPVCPLPAPPAGPERLPHTPEATQCTLQAPTTPCLSSRETLSSTCLACALALACGNPPVYVFEFFSLM